MAEGGRHTSHYVSLVMWTDRGLQQVMDAPQRFTGVIKMVENLGGTIEIFSTMGEYDFVAIVEAPSDEIAMQAALQLESAGNARTMTMKAWTLDEAAKILARLE